jgi:hypothetical protein
LDVVPASHNLVDALAASPAISKRSRWGITRALDTAYEAGRTFPTPADCLQASIDTGADHQTIAAAWGYVRPADPADAGDDGRGWLNIRRTYSGEDGRHGIVPTQEALLCLMVFSLLTDTPIPFGFDVGKRRRALGGDRGAQHPADPQRCG